MIIFCISEYDIEHILSHILIFLCIDFYSSIVLPLQIKYKINEKNDIYQSVIIQWKIVSF